MAIKLIAPVNGPITQYFGENPQIYSRWGYAGHNGIDYGIPNGTPIVAAADGTVEKAEFEDGGYGFFVGFGGAFIDCFSLIGSKKQSAANANSCPN